jgi:hypothetical protein
MHPSPKLDYGTLNSKKRKLVELKLDDIFERSGKMTQNGLVPEPFDFTREGKP